MNRSIALRWLCGANRRPSSHKHRGDIMSKSRARLFLFALTAFVCASFSPAHALWFVSFVSGSGKDTNDCSRGAPCGSLAQAISQTAPGGQVTIMDTGAFGPAFITQSLSIVNDTGATATDCCAVYTPGIADAYIVIAAGPNDVVTLRGITINPSGNVFPNSTAVLIENARQVNIEKCTIRNMTASGIILAPSSAGQLASSIDLKIEDTVVTGSAAGADLTSVPSLPVNVTISKSSFQSNIGGGIKVDGTKGGPIKVAITDSTISLNGSNGVNAVSGPSGNVRVNLIRDVIASNGQAGVQSNQSNGGSASVTVSQSMLSSNGSAWSNVGGATLLSYQNNEVTGTTGTPPSPAAFQ